MKKNSIQSAIIFIAHTFSMVAMDQSIQQLPITFEYSTSTTSSYIYAKQDEKTIGKIIYFQLPRDNNDSAQEAFIDDLKVSRDHYKKGIGSELFIKSLEDLRSKKSSVVHWYAFESVDFYKKFGARVIAGSRLYTKSAHMQFDFSKDGDPRINRTKSRKQNEINS